MKIQLKAILNRKNISSKTVYEDLHISKQVFSNYVTNRSQPDIDTIFLLANYLNITVEELYGKKPKEELEQLKNEIREISIRLRQMSEK